MENSFPFIVSSGPKLQNDPETRKTIRKQAMRDVGLARKKRTGTFGKQNAGQCPQTAVQIRPAVSSSVSNSSTSDSPESAGSDSSGSASKDTDITEAELDEYLDWQLVPTKSTSPSINGVSFLQTLNLLSGYETTRLRFNVDITDLSMLTNFNVGKSTIPGLSADPSRLPTLLGQQQWSYLHYIPSRYGESPCLTAATDCVLAKVRSVLAPQSGYEETELRLYAKALNCLQKAISDQTSCTKPDVLCATQMLSLHELLDPSADSAWSHHVKGSARIVRHRGPRRFNTDFEKALFAGHVGTVVSEALLADEHCYLEQPEWSQLYREMAQESDFLTDRSPLTLKVRLTMFKLPGESIKYINTLDIWYGWLIIGMSSGLWHDVDVLVAGPQLFDESAVAELEGQCRALQTELLAWTEDYKVHCVRLSLASPTPQEIALRRELFGTSVECLLLVKRLLATVCDSERFKLEGEVQALALLIFELQKQPSPKHSWLFTGHETGVAYTITTTRDQWEEEAAAGDIERKLATRSRYTTWSRMLRMTEET